eukprot:scaffold3586_cov164-Amphora_coffeaeformis.AAC.25
MAFRLVWYEPVLAGVVCVHRIRLSGVFQLFARPVWLWLVDLNHEQWEWLRCFFAPSHAHARQNHKSESDDDEYVMTTNNENDRWRRNPTHRQKIWVRAEPVVLSENTTEDLT